MELTTIQIQKIDERLKRRGIKYWDLRIEMVDHIVSDLEHNAKTDDFKVELENSLRKIGWQAGLRDLNTQGWKNVNKIYRKDYFKGFVDFFKKPKNVLIFIISLFFLFIISEKIAFKNFQRLSFFLFASPIIFVFYMYIRERKKKLGRSVNLDYGTTYLTLSFLILQGIPQLFRGQPEITQKTIWFIILSIHFVAFFSGYLLYKKAIAKVEKMKKEMSL